MADSYVYGTIIFPGDVQMTGTGSIPALSVTDAKVATLANIVDTKICQRFHVGIHETGEAAAMTRIVYICHRAATVLSAKCAITAVAVTDKAAVIDIKKSTAGGAFGTILTGTYTVDNSKAVLTHYDLTLSGTPTLIADDLLEVVITVSGSTGNYPYGLCVDIALWETGT